MAKKMGIWSNNGNPQVFKPGLIQDPPISNHCSFKIFNCPFSSGISQLATAMMMTSEGTILAAENPSTSQGQSMVGFVYSDDNPQSIQVRIS